MHLGFKVLCFDNHTKSNFCNHTSSGKQYINLPLTLNEVNDKTTKFGQTFNIPQCLGAIDGTHIEIKQPSVNSSNYINRKSRFSLNVLACCDYRYCLWML